ncbi:hypothetical protein F5Y12DRAFT_710597 [Xylaria sp. FL1777]|nr:hypothetical protein F5Y12DRAFT_710597 [Xylaria sp. FL1777]
MPRAISSQCWILTKPVSIESTPLDVAADLKIKAAKKVHRQFHLLYAASFTVIIIGNGSLAKEWVPHPRAQSIAVSPSLPSSAEQQIARMLSVGIAYNSKLNL